MELRFSKEDEEFRDEARTWLAEHKPTDAGRPRAGPATREFDLAWQRVQYDAGWAGISLADGVRRPRLPLMEQLIWYEEFARAGALESIDAVRRLNATAARR